MELKRNKKQTFPMRILLKRIWQFIRPYQGKLYLSVFLTFMDGLLSTLEPYVFGLVITELGRNVVAIINQEPGASINTTYIFWVLVIYLIRGCIVQLSLYGANHYLTEAVQSTIQDLRNTLSQKLNRIPVQYFDTNQFGDVLGRFTSDVETISNAMQQSFSQIVNAIFKITMVVVMMLTLNWKLAIIVILSMPLSAFIARLILKKSQKHFDLQANLLGDLFAYVQENLSGFDVIKLYGQEEKSVEIIKDKVGALRETGFISSFLSGLLMPFIMGISYLTYGVVTFFGVQQVFAGQLTIGNLQAFTSYVSQINQPIQVLTQLSSILQSASAAGQRIFEFLDEEEESDTATRHMPADIQGRVSFDDVSFQYTPTKPLIQDFEVEVKPGEMIAIVGPTGAGKTTMINLLMRFYDVTKGAIKVEGIDIREVPRKEHRQQFGMVLQDAWLYEASVKENLRFGKLDATDEEVIAAAKAANVDHFIRTLPGGYDMVINQEATNISQGQKQLLTIARALLANPKILILDEATSSVDTRLEKLIQVAMANLMENRTSFVIAHRLSTIQDADRILVMRDGQIIEHGNHEELMDRQGFYYDLYQSQFSD